MTANVRSGILRPLILIILAALTLLIAACGSGSSGSGGSDPGRVAVITDFHFTPFYDPAIFDQLMASDADQWEAVFESSTMTRLPQYGEETNYPLLVKALDSIVQMERDPAYVVFPGDILTHHFNTLFYKYYGSQDPEALESFIYKTIRFFALQLRKRYGAIPIYFTLGNTDAYAGDYALVPGGKFLSQTATVLNTLLLPGVESEDYFTTYPKGGYYSASMSDGHTMLISMNSVLFSHRRPAPTPPGPGQDAGWDQLDWLAGRLAQARKDTRNVLLVTHVPPGSDIYATQAKYLDASGRLSGAELMWHTVYHERFLGLADEYKDMIRIIYAAHTHMDEYRLLSLDPEDPDPIPLLLTPSISPIFRNNPGYKIARLSGDGIGWENFEVHTMNLAAEGPAFAFTYDFKTQYRVGEPTGENLARLYTLIKSGETEDKDAYIKRYYGNAAGSIITDHNWPVYCCGIRAMTVDRMVACVNN